MTIELIWEPDLYSIILSALWIFRDTTLVLWARRMKKRENRSKNINLLLASGILLLAWDTISFFLPGFRLSFVTESELRVVATIFCLYDVIPIILGVFLGIALSIYFYRLNDKLNWKAILGPGIFLLGYITSFFFVINNYYVLVEEPLLYFSNYNAYMIGYVIIKILPVIGFCFIFLYSLHMKNEFLIMFCGLYFAFFTLSLVQYLNFAIREIYYYG